MNHYLTMSAPDAIARVQHAFAGNDVAAQREWARATLENAAALELLQSRITHASSVDVDLMLRLLTTRAYELRETYEEDRPPLWFLDWFRNERLIYPLDRGVVAMVSRTRDYQNGEVRFIGDKTDDWPTEGGRMETGKLRAVKHFGKSVEYGILELWQSAREGRDIIGERITDALRDMDVFIDFLIANGAPMHLIYGFLGHPDIAVSVVPASVVPPLGTTWPQKTPSEVLFDLATMRDTSRVDANYNSMADTAIMADSRYTCAASSLSLRITRQVLVVHHRLRLASSRGKTLSFRSCPLSSSQLSTTARSGRLVLLAQHRPSISSVPAASGLTPASNPRDYPRSAGRVV